MAIVIGTVSVNDPATGDVTVTPEPPEEPVLFIGLQLEDPDHFQDFEEANGLDVTVDYTEALPYIVHSVTPL